LSLFKWLTGWWAVRRERRALKREPRLDFHLDHLRRAGDDWRPDRLDLYHLVRWLDPHSVLEIGTHTGASTLAFATALRENAASGTKGYRTLVSVDIEDVNDPELGVCSAADKLEKIGCRELVTFVTASSADFLRLTSNSFQLILLDGDNAAPAVYRDISLALRRLAPGGVILVNTGGPGVRVALERICKEQPEFQAATLGLTGLAVAARA